MTAAKHPLLQIGRGAPDGLCKFDIIAFTIHTTHGDITVDAGAAWQLLKSLNPLIDEDYLKCASDRAAELLQKKRAERKGKK